MLDIQAVYVRDIAELRGIRYVSMLRVNARTSVDVSAGYGNITDTTVATVSRVTVNNHPANFIKKDLTTLLVAMPEQIKTLGKETGVYTPMQSVTNITVYRSGVDSEGVEVEVPEVITDLGGPSGGVNPKAPAGSQRVTIDGGILQLTGKKFDKAVSVQVNKTNQEFSVVDQHTILCTLPEKASVIESVEVITTAKKINRNSVFSYLLTDNVNAVSGETKLIQQFIKVLLTTPGSDHFAPTVGGNMQNWVNQNQPYGSSQALVAKTVLNIVNVAARFSAGQTLAGVPPEERLSDVQVLNVGFAADDPSLMELSLRLNTFARRQAVVSVLIGQAKEGIASAAAQAPAL